MRLIDADEFQKDLGQVWKWLAERDNKGYGTTHGEMLDKVHDILVKQPTAYDIEWKEIKTRPITEEEYEFLYDCELPYNNQEVLITTKYGYVEKTTFYTDYGCYFEQYEDEDDVLAWMPLPTPYIKVGENK